MEGCCETFLHLNFPAHTLRSFFDRLIPSTDTSPFDRSNRFSHIKLNQVIMKSHRFFCVIIISYLGAISSWCQDGSSSVFDKIIETIHRWDVESQDRGIPLITAFSSPNFNGSRLELNHDWSGRRNQYWNDEIASIEVPYGYRVLLFEHADFRGRELMISHDWSVRENPWWRNRISSIRIIPDYHQEEPYHHYCHECGRRSCNCHYSSAVTINSRRNFNGRSLRLRKDWTVSDEDDYWNDRISAMDVPPGFVVILYKRPYFRGRSERIEGPWTSEQCDDTWDRWTNEISSIRIIRRFR